MVMAIPAAHHPLTPPESRSVAVIGAGAAGLCAALELRREGHKVVVYERENQLGGTWVYTPEVESDLIGLNPARKVVHSSLYASLRTNLPRELMGFRSFPFLPSNKPGRDSRRFPGHAEVLEYLKDFSEEFNIGEMVRYGTEVRHVSLGGDQNWVVKSRKTDGEEEFSEVYDAVVVCEGHYTEPRIAEIPGIDEWPGKQVHSHNYRTPDAFLDQIVVLIGNSASAYDISQDLVGFAKEVHVSSRSDGNELGISKAHDNIYLHSMIEKGYEDGRIAFCDGTVIKADVILHCTGYKYFHPFLDTNGIISVEDNRVGPLYKHVFPPTLAPWLSFVGIPWKVVPFPLFELQSKWIAGTLSGRITLPSAEEMLADVGAFYASLEQSQIPKRYTHQMGISQFEYGDWLAAESGSPPVEVWRKPMYVVTGQRRRSFQTYRDQWEDHDLISLAHLDFQQARP